jgi:alkaline phosphatase D
MFKPTVGPIIGHTTTDHARIFVRGKFQKHSQVFAGIRYRQRGDVTWMNSVFCQLEHTRDMSQVMALNELAADTEYEYQAGWFTVSSSVNAPDTLTELPLQWPGDIYRFRTHSTQVTRPRAYIFGSCRYLRLTAGVPILPHLSDRIFASIAQLAEQSDPPISSILMTGDQVYVDDLNAVAPDCELAEILTKYRSAFSQPNISQVMSSTPTYMILDDHEIENNWPTNRSRHDDQLYNNAMFAYELYQASHSPTHDLLDNGQVNPASDRYWYQFSEGDIEWFVIDCRTQRNLAPNDRRMLDEKQELALSDWLINSTARVKLVVTSVMMYPDLIINGDDGWKGFPQQRLRLLETIRKHRIKNVVIVSGDVHGSLVSRLTHSEDPEFEIHTLVSSPLSNSRMLPYARARSFILDPPLARTEAGEYRHDLVGEVISQDNFAHLVIDRANLRVSYHGRAGNLLQRIDIPLR